MGRKKSSVRLHLFMNSKKVGHLDKPNHGGLRLKYDEEWLKNPNAIPLSLSLPLTKDTYSGDIVFSYFDNLLPDSDPVRKRLVEASGAASSDAFDLLQELGRDCVGALQLIAEDQKFDEGFSLDGDVLQMQEVAKILKNLKVTPLGYDPDDDFRISIAGAQPKTALLKLNGEWIRPKGTTPTSHILKPSIGKLANGIDLSNSVENEFICLKFCEFFGLPVANAEIIHFDKEPCLVVERFDRIWSKDSRRLFRLPQEDFCQSLGVSGGRKYQNQGGPSFVDGMKLLSTSDNPKEDQEIFLRAQLVFFLLGATDGHAKNFSIFLNPTGFRMTPLYDVLSAEPAVKAGQIRWNKNKLAMSFGQNKHYQINSISFRHFEESCAMASYSKQSFYELITDILIRSGELESWTTSLGYDQESEVIYKGIQKRLKILAAG